MVLAFGFILASVIFVSVEATCTNANSNCATWVSNGFCGSSFYTCAQKQSYCALSCNIGGCSPQTTCSTTSTGTCVDKDSRCATWVANGFCTSSFYTSQRCSYCPLSCNLCSSCSSSTTTPPSACTTLGPTTCTSATSLATCSSATCPTATPTCVCESAGAGATCCAKTTTATCSMTATAGGSACNGVYCPAGMAGPGGCGTETAGTICC